MPGSFLNLKILSSNFRHCENIQVSGKKITSSTNSTPLNARANPSGCSLAIVLGVISPNMSTASVITAVDTVTACELSDMSDTKNNVASDDATMFTMLFPISIVVISLS